MFNLFQKADQDGDGFLNRDEFRSCINDASLGLTRREVIPPTSPSPLHCCTASSLR
jgi:hypothetical protein